MLTAERLREVLRYEPETGEFWRDGRVVGTKNSKYVMIRLDCVLYYAHRLAWLYMTGELPPKDIDHADGDRKNNKWANLRSATRSQNLGNRKLCGRNKSGYKGVSFDKARGLWEVHIRKDGRSRFLGRYTDPEEAHEAYRRAATELFGEFARFA